jgi:trehalose/maltose hydrolase-like predicted phosphorylase
MNGVGTMEHALEPTADAAWLLYEVGYDPLRESSSESRFAISNGFLGVRGSRATTRGARCVVPPRTYVAGLFDTPGAERATLGLVPAADWLQVRILLPGGPLVHHPGDASTHHRTLDVRRGALLSECRQLTAPDVCIRLRTLRLVSLSERAIGLQLIQLEIEHGEVEVTLEASLEGVNLELVSERLEQDLGVWRQGPRHGNRIVAADRRPRSSADRARPIKMVLDLEISPRAGRVFRTLRRSGAERHPRSGPWQRSA